MRAGSVLFFDPACPHPYTARTLSEAALGGTEATAVRVAEALGAFVVQHNRTQAEGRYVPPGPLAGIEHVVVMRDARPLAALHALFPAARKYLWLHDLVRPGSKRGRRLAANGALLDALGVMIVCVSDFQRHGVEAVLAGLPNRNGIRTARIHNPIDDALRPDESAVDPAKLVFFSSPNKGLAYTLDAFSVLRRRVPGLRLHVANPGYKHLRRTAAAGVEWLDALPHRDVVAQVRSALCVFYPNFVLPETFGLVFAEANAVGTPVLTHTCGAAAEVLADTAQHLPVERSQALYERAARALPASWRTHAARVAGRHGVFDAYVERIEAWRRGERPRVGPDPRFRLAHVAREWQRLFANGAAAP